MKSTYCVVLFVLPSVASFALLERLQRYPLALNAKGFGSSSAKKKTKKKSTSRLINALDPNKSSNKPSSGKRSPKPYVKSEQDQLLANLQAAAAKSCLGRAVAEATANRGVEEEVDPFWELIPSLIQSKFPQAKDRELQRVAGFLRHTLDPNLPLEDEIVNNPHRPHDEIHAYMPGLGPTAPFHDPDQLDLCKKLSENFEVIRDEYHALLADMAATGNDRFQSVTSMNYEGGWRTVVLFYNGHRIDGFPYHLCPVTTRLLESVPLAGRIAGFNRQRPRTGIPRHSDGNNMWLTCQMGVHIPEDQMAYINVGTETKRWQEGECLLYDTTYSHETFNEHETQERVVLHVDFFNTLAMTPLEVNVMQYIYSLREQFMKAEGVSKVGAQIL